MDRVTASAALLDMASRIGGQMSPDQAEAIVRYCDLLLRWAAKINLTGAKTIDQLVRVHLPDAVAASRIVVGAQRVVDVGSGAGLPALPLALLCPEASFEMFEPTGKKVAFLRTAIRELGLGSRVAVRDRRVDQSAASEPAGVADIAMSRATFAPEEWLRIGLGLVRLGGRVLVFLAGRSLDPAPGSQLLETVSYDADGAPRRLAVYQRL